MALMAELLATNNDDGNRKAGGEGKVAGLKAISVEYIFVVQVTIVYCFLIVIMYLFNKARRAGLERALAARPGQGSYGHRGRIPGGSIITVGLKNPSNAATIALQRKPQEKGDACEVDVAPAGAGDPDDGTGGSTATPLELFHSLQRYYLIAVILCYFADWLKGPYVYALYEAYGMGRQQIALLFISGFVSSLALGTCVAALADRYGRRFMCLAFCFIYGSSAFTKLFPSFAILLLGRVLSGIATSILFTCFEAWMVAEHRRRGLDDSLLPLTFSRVTVWNGIAAICAGLTAQAVARLWGYAAPFLTAVPPLLVAAIIVMRHWQHENYGAATEDHRGRLAALWAPFRRGGATLFQRKQILLLGLGQAFFEAAMYLWVFYWTPCLVRHAPGTEQGPQPPIGLIFAAFMAAIMLGGLLCEAIMNRSGSEPKAGAILAAGALHATALASMLLSLACYYYDPDDGGGNAASGTEPPNWIAPRALLFLLFTVFELCCGCYFVSYGTLRSLFIPEHSRGAIMNMIRLPMNGIVVAVLVALGGQVLPGLVVLCVLLALSLVFFIMSVVALGFE